VKCYNHQDIDAVGVCTNCGRFVCETCKTEWQGSFLCQSCFIKKFEDQVRSQSAPTVTSTAPTYNPPPVQPTSYPPPEAQKVEYIHAASPVVKPQKKSNKKPLLIGGMAGGAIIVVVAIILGLTLGRGNETSISLSDIGISEAYFEDWVNSFEPMINQKVTDVKSTLISAGLPVTGVYIEPIKDGKKVLLVVVSFDKLNVGSKPGSFIVSSLQSLVKIAMIKTINLSGIDFVTAAIKDSNGRIIVQSGASSSNVDAFRNGKISQSTFIQQTVTQVEDRFAAFDAMTR